MTEITPCYSGEALLLRWGDSPKGRTVTLQLDEHVGEQHPFKGYRVGGNGQRMQMVCVLIDENEEPQQPRTDAPARTKKHFDEMPLSQQAGMMLQKPEFQEWIDKQYESSDFIICRQNDEGPYRADETLKIMLNIQSKKELDADPEAGDRWKRLYTTFVNRELVR